MTQLNMGDESRYESKRVMSGEDHKNSPSHISLIKRHSQVIDHNMSAQCEILVQQSPQHLSPSVLIK